MKTSLTIPGAAPRLFWIQQAPEPGVMYAAECGRYIFEISKAAEPGTGYLLQVRQTRPKDWFRQTPPKNRPLVCEMAGFSLKEAKA